MMLLHDFFLPCPRNNYLADFQAHNFENRLNNPRFFFAGETSESGGNVLNGGEYDVNVDV